ncbi:hypothetical protein BH23ACT10_BH23ACT10_38990 [soil metagenome]
MAVADDVEACGCGMVRQMVVEARDGRVHAGSRGCPGTRRHARRSSTPPSTRPDGVEAALAGAATRLVRETARRSSAARRTRARSTSDDTARGSARSRAASTWARSRCSAVAIDSRRSAGSSAAIAASVTASVTDRDRWCRPITAHLAPHDGGAPVRAQRQPEHVRLPGVLGAPPPLGDREHAVWVDLLLEAVEERATSVGGHSAAVVARVHRVRPLPARMATEGPVTCSYARSGAET